MAIDNSLMTTHRILPGDAADHLIDAVQKLSNVTTIEEVTSIVKKAARQMTGADGTTFVLRDGDLCHYVDEDSIEPLWKGRRFPIEICISGWVMRHRQPTVIDNVFADHRIPQDAYRPTFVKSLAMVPIRSLDPIGAIGLYWRYSHRPTAEAVRWLQSLADSTALAIEHLNGRMELLETKYNSELLRFENNELRHDSRVRESSTIKMCFITNRVEVDGKWLSIENFLHKRFGLEVTHGLSPEALARLDDHPLDDAEPVPAAFAPRAR